MVNWCRSVELACERIVEFISNCKFDVQSVQQLQFALADFEAELSMALASSSSTKEKKEGSDKEDESLSLPKVMFEMVYDESACMRTVGWRAFTFLVKSDLPLGIIIRDGDEGKRFVLHLVRALDGCDSCMEEQLEALQLLLALCTAGGSTPTGTTKANPVEKSLWTIVLPSVVNACEVDFGEEEVAGSTCHPRILLKALEVLRNIATHLPLEIRSLKHIRPLLSTLCTLGFLDPNHTFAISLEEHQREAVAMASQCTLSILLSHVAVRRNLGWDVSSFFGPIVSPFMNIAIAQVPEKDVEDWDQMDTLRELPHCMEGMFRMSQSWTGVYLLTKHTKAEKSILEVLVQAFADTKVKIVRCVFVMLFSGLLDLPMDENAVKYWIEHTGIDLRFKGFYFGSRGMANERLESPPSSNMLLERSSSGEYLHFDVSDLASRVRKSILVNALFEAGLHFHLKNAMKEKYEPKTSIPLLMEGILEIAHFCMTRKNLIEMQGSHHNMIVDRDESAAVLPAATVDELPDMSYLLYPSDESARTRVMTKLQKIVLGSDTPITANSTSSEERKTIIRTLSSNPESPKFAKREDFKLEGTNGTDTTDIEDKLEKLQQLMDDSGVLKYSSANWRLWKWEYITLILDCCKGTPEEGIRLCMRSKLLKRIFAFYAKRLPSVPIDNYKGKVGIQCGMKFMKLLVDTEEGRNFLSGKSSFLDQLPEVNIFDIIVKGLQLETGQSKTNKERIFHPALVKHTHAFGLLRIALVIADTRRGVHMLYRVGIPQTLGQVVESGSNLELCKVLFDHLDLFVNEFPQELVRKALSLSDSTLFSSSLLSLKKHLLKLAERKGIEEESKSKTIMWLAKLFVDILDTVPKKRQTYLATLAATFCSLGFTKYLATAGVSRLEEKIKGFPILLEHLLLDAKCFELVEEKGWLEEYVRNQFCAANNHRFMSIVQNIYNLNFGTWLTNSIAGAKSSVEEIMTREYRVLSNELCLKNVFYILACTNKGIDWLVQHKILETLVERIEDNDEASVSREACLWYLAMIASASEAAGKKVVESGGIDTIQFTAITSFNFLLRGQACLALNIASNNNVVKEYLSEKFPRWNVFKVDSRVENRYARLCLPHNMSSYLNLPTRKSMMHIQRWCDSHRQKELKPLLSEKNKAGGADEAILSAFAKLTNPLAEEDGKVDLARLRKTCPEKLTMMTSSLFLHELLLKLDFPRGVRAFLWDVISIK